MERTPNSSSSSGIPVGSPGNDAHHRKTRPRVCDRCIRKKVKCSLELPACSLCVKHGYTCTYSSIRRKPGPPRGSRHDPLPSPSRLPPPPPTPGSSTTTVGESLVSASTSSNASIQLDILPEEEKFLLHTYFETIHDANPIFPEQHSPLLTQGLSRDLILTIVITTAKLTKFEFTSQNLDIEACIDKCLTSDWLAEDIFRSSPSLDQFRIACLLAFYEFHMFPGQQAWMHIGTLVRGAYWVGLDRIESLRFLYHDWGAMGQDEIERWRMVWWCAFRLDSYANLATGTPYQIDETLVDTALRQGNGQLSAPGDCAGSSSRICVLPPDPDSLWELVVATQSSSASKEIILFNHHIATTTAVRQVGRKLQLKMQRPRREANVYIATLERNLSSIRLALSTDYLNPRRNSSSHEAASEHHKRLATMLHLHIARLLVSVMRCSRCVEEGDEWFFHWQQVLEACQEIASVSEQWDGVFTPSTDPAVSFILFTAVIFLHFHQKSSLPLSSLLHAKLQRCEEVLLLHLEQFASVWTLPRLLVLSIKSVKESLNGPLTFEHIQIILTRFESPLHPRWLQFLSSA